MRCFTRRSHGIGREGRGDGWKPQSFYCMMCPLLHDVPGSGECAFWDAFWGVDRVLMVARSLFARNGSIGNTPGAF